MENTVITVLTTRVTKEGLVVLDLTGFNSNAINITTITQSYFDTCCTRVAYNRETDRGLRIEQYNIETNQWDEYYATGCLMTLR
jgi:hemolysin-activating ACP:hemolysin acyltransferase